MNVATNGDNKATIMKLGAGPTLLKLLDEGAPDAKAQVSCATRNLATNEDNQVTLMKLGAALKLLKLLDEGTPFAKVHAAGAFWNLATRHYGDAHEAWSGFQIVEAGGRGHARCGCSEAYQCAYRWSDGSIEIHSHPPFTVRGGWVGEASRRCHLGPSLTHAAP